ncbi:hypothetical protein Pcinc_032695 [Petrolisthes cinctipes]|uniref:Uncharacterized protein n=1 Tax=Petrolisthes cinctipes TaxID=88211 RepID=A0AAE1ETJ6_PETCI|nr:hypothetical protein Pcinc_032695 [Petrolisthes cinctipes]
MKLSVKLLVLAAVVGVLEAAPPKQPRLQPHTKVPIPDDILDKVNEAVANFLGTLQDPLPFPKNPLVLDVGSPGEMFDLRLVMNDATLGGIHNIDVTAIEEILSTTEIVLTSRAHQLTFDIPYYNITGRIVDHLDMTGEGPAQVIMDDFDVILSGKILIGDTSNLLSDIQFETLTLDLELYRWTVNFEGLMPGTDMGTVFNEFFTMCGPELMDMLEIKINENGKLLDFINDLLPHPEKSTP